MGRVFKIYHVRDTALFGDMRLIATYYKPDLIMIPIGGRILRYGSQGCRLCDQGMAAAQICDPCALRHNPELKGKPLE